MKKTLAHWRPTAEQPAFLLKSCMTAKLKHLPQLLKAQFRLLLGITCAGLCLELGACRAKLNVKSQVAKAASTGKPTLVPDGFNTSRSFFQSRSTIAIHVSSKMVAPGEHFSLVNESTKAVLVDNQPLSFPSDGGQAALDGPGSYQISVEFYPLDQDSLGQFTYGTNLLHLTADSKASEEEVTLQDFGVTGSPLAYFPSGEQSQDGFQGELSATTQAVVTNGTSYLLTGMIHIITQ